MAETTQIHPDKGRANLATSYRLGHTEHDIVPAIGQRPERLAALFAASGVDCVGQGGLKFLHSSCQRPIARLLV